MCRYRSGMKSGRWAFGPPVADPRMRYRIKNIFSGRSVLERVVRATPRTRFPGNLFFRLVFLSVAFSLNIFFFGCFFFPRFPGDRISFGGRCGRKRAAVRRRRIGPVFLKWMRPGFKCTRTGPANRFVRHLPARRPERPETKTGGNLFRFPPVPSLPVHRPALRRARGRPGDQQVILSFEPSTFTILCMYSFFMFSRAGPRYFRGSNSAGFSANT